MATANGIKNCELMATIIRTFSGVDSQNLQRRSFCKAGFNYPDIQEEIYFEMNKEEILATKPKNLSGLLTNMLDTFMYPMEQGQIRSNKEKLQTVELPTSKYVGNKSDNERKKELNDIVKGIAKKNDFKNAKRLEKLDNISVELIDFATGLTDEFRGNDKLATAKILEEYEEHNKHGLNNENGTDHVVGVYRWVDKIMQCRLVNYGKRLLFEFMVPEPAAFHIFAKSRKSFKGVFVEKPIHPKVGITNPLAPWITLSLNTPEQLDATNYKIWAGAYNAQVEPYPTNITIGKAFADLQPTGAGWPSKTNADNSIKIPDGFMALSGEALFMYEGAGGHSMTMAIGDVYLNSWSYTPALSSGKASFILDPLIDVVPISWFLNASTCASINIEINCAPKQATLANWQLKTYQAILDAYQRKLDEFTNAIMEAQINEGITIDGNNPLSNRETEKIELKKACLQLMTENDFFESFNAMKHPEKTKSDYDNYPYFDNCDAIEEGHVVNFFESIFDWNIMSYFLHPYFWSNRQNWVEIYNTKSNDPLHQSFLQAGFARVVVPVKLGFENIAFNITEGNVISYDAALIGVSPEIIDATEELSQNNLPITDPDYVTSDLNPANFATWEVRLPTNLVLLQKNCDVVDDELLPENDNVI
jgi:hypothetical protein